MPPYCKVMEEVMYINFLNKLMTITLYSYI